MTARRPRRRQTNSRPTLWDHGEFIAVDGEGFSEGEPFRIHLGKGSTPYRGRDHYYAYLSASDGASLYNPSGRLSLLSCLSFLCGIVERNPRAILVAFGASYDIVSMVGHDLFAHEIKQLLGKDKTGRRLYVASDTYVYSLEYAPRKCLTVRRWPANERRWTRDKHGKPKATPHLTVRLWDVIGFFQESFTGVMRKWLPGDPDYEMIAREKANRNVFERGELETIKRYNAAELRCLVKIMNKVRDAINDLGLKISRWDGAGAIAAAFMNKFKVKEHKSGLPPEIFLAARCAYSGGHIEACKVGHYTGKVHHYDINSAYPAEFAKLPSLVGGAWVRGTGEPPPGYTLVKVRFAFSFNQPFYPLFYRCPNGTILYPSFGSGWYHYSEFEAGAQYYAKHGGAYYDVLEWFHFRRHVDGELPFGWVGDIYLSRQNYINAARNAGIENGPEKIIKLGLNSLYGKTCQQVGARRTQTELRLPPYFQLDWAGFVTAGCRAKLLLAALQRPQAVIAFATDGLFSMVPLELDCPADKRLGAWEYTVHSGITIVMPGVYWLHDDAKVKHYSRGFDKSEMGSPEFVIEAWRRGQESLPIKLTRLIGLGTALTSEGFWRMRGCFVECDRTLALDGDNSKRYAIDVKRTKPHLGLVDTIPREHFLPNFLGVPDSAPYPIAWLDGGDPDNWQNDAESEAMDTLEAMDAELA